MCDSRGSSGSRDSVVLVCLCNDVSLRFTAYIHCHTSHFADMRKRVRVTMCKKVHANTLKNARVRVCVYLFSPSSDIFYAEKF